MMCHPHPTLSWGAAQSPSSSPQTLPCPSFALASCPSRGEAGVPSPRTCSGGHFKSLLSCVHWGSTPGSRKHVSPVARQRGGAWEQVPPSPAPGTGPARGSCGPRTYCSPPTPRPAADSEIHRKWKQKQKLPGSEAAAQAARGRRWGGPPHARFSPKRVPQAGPEPPSSGTAGLYPCPGLTPPHTPPGLRHPRGQAGLDSPSGQRGQGDRSPQTGATPVQAGQHMATPGGCSSGLPAPGRDTQEDPQGGGS